MRDKPDVKAEVAALSDLSRDELVERWRKANGVLPPKGVRQDLLIRAAAWHLQAKRLGGYSAETRHLLRSAIARVESEMLTRDGRAKAAAEEQVNAHSVDQPLIQEDSAACVTSPSRERRRLTPGARLMREWSGRTHIVDVIEGGFVFEAKIYPSLTAIAGKITGVHQSGPRFFGL
ncbi:MAG TPA: DUF2924 domain-containing protein [Rhizobiaceae bacterium]|nr:DUF2924 domain-containing protein [Rhizobiaceae bacterium]